jgi:pyruvate,orthophosphate dikinase
MPYVFDFDHRHRRAPKDLKDLLGGKGANLAEMSSVLRLPVPPGFTITTDACRSWMASGYPDGLDGEVARATSRLERSMKKRLGDPSDPLLVSVRSGAKFSMPGMMDTVLNLGLNDRSVEGLASQTKDRRFALDSYRRFVSMYGRIVLDVDARLFDERFEEARSDSGAPNDAAIPEERLAALVVEFKELVAAETGRPFPEDPKVQLRGAIEAVFSSWSGPRAVAYREREGIPHDLGTAVNVQAMVFGNRDDRSGTGVGFTRDPATGRRGTYGDFLVNAQGEDVVAGIRITEPLSAMRRRFPKAHAELLEVFDRLEVHYRDMCDTEFTIEQGRLWMLQTRVGKRTGRAAVRMAVEMTRANDLGISRAEALARVTEDHLDQLLHPQFADDRPEPIARGLGASPGAAVGRCYFTADEAFDAAQRGEHVLLVRPETSPEDVRGMLAADGILTSRGGLVSHAAVVARGWGKPAVVGAEAVVVHGGTATIAGRHVAEGDWLSIDGGSGEIMVGQVALTASEPSKELVTLLRWADEVRKGRMAVRANADTADDAAVARRLGAEGIGLCRTEHMFFGEDRIAAMREMILAETQAERGTEHMFLAEDRLPIVRRMILAVDDDAVHAALEELRVAQRADFEGILAAMDGLPVTVRLLDPPLHEFLPSTEELAVKEASVGLDDEERALLAAARSWKEVNPMLGTRGVRLGVVRAGLYEMQVRALMEAALDRIAKKGRPVIEIMIPLTVSRAELALARSWVESTVEATVPARLRRRLAVTIGTMVETPRAALVAADLAKAADFFSFGTNDLTQMTFGFSRDDVEGRLMGPYLERGLLAANPFDTIDPEGVGELVRIAVREGRRTTPHLKCGVCGEHGGDPRSIALFVDAGLDYVSCSPYRVPVARLAAAQALAARDS